MKHVISFALGLWLPLAGFAQEAPDDRYIAVYDMIQQADALADGNNSAAAQAKYSEAQAALVKFQQDFPAWNVKIVNFRLNYLAGKTKTPLPQSVTESVAAAVAKTAEAPPAPENPVLVNAMQAELRQAQADKAALEDKLKTALAAQAAASNTVHALTQAQTQIQSLTDENQILKSTLRLQKLNSVPPVDPAKLEQLGKDLAEARLKLDANTKTITTLTQEKDALQKQLTVAVAENKSGANLNQTAALQEQLKQLEADKTALAAKLKEAAAQAALLDPRQLAQAEEKLKQLQKENTLLRAGLEQRQTDSIPLTNTVQLAQTRQELLELNRKLQEQTDLSAKLAQDKEAMQKQLAAANLTAQELAETKRALAALKRKYSIQTEAAIILISEANLKIARQNKLNASLTKENQSLQKQLGSLASNAKFVVEGLRTENQSLTKQLTERKKTAPAPSAEDKLAMEQLQTQLAKLRAKLNVLEATPIPFTPEELALFRRPESATLASTAGDKKTRPKLPTGASDLILEAQKLFAQHNYDQARAKYLEVLDLDPRNVYTLGNLATIELELNQTDQAELHLQAALAINPKDAFSLGVLGNLRFRQGKYDQALDALSHAAELNPKDAEIQNFLGVTLSQKGQRAAAETALRKAIQLDPEYGSAHNNLAVIYLTQNPPQVELARWHYQKALAAGQSRNAELESLLDQSAQPAPAKP